MPTNTTGLHSQPETRASDYRLCDALVTMNSTSNNKERKPDLMESMIDGGFEREGGGQTPLFLTVNSTICTPPIMWIRTRRLFNSSFERRVDRGESSGGGFEGRDWQGVCAVPSRDVPRGTVPGCAVGRRDRASAVD